MSDSLITGSRRLGAILADGHISTEMQMEILTSDPGVIALVELVQSMKQHPARFTFDWSPHCVQAAREALHKWEHGNA